MDIPLFIVANPRNGFSRCSTANDLHTGVPYPAFMVLDRLRNLPRSAASSRSPTDCSLYQCKFRLVSDSVDCRWLTGGANPVAFLGVILFGTGLSSLSCTIFGVRACGGVPGLREFLSE